MCVLPNLLMLPFARSDLNAIILGPDFSGVMTVLPFVFLITLVGYFSMLAGGGLWRLWLGIGVRDSIMPLLRVPYRISMMMMSSRKVLVFQAVLCLALQALVLGIYFLHQGIGFDLRSYTFANPALRPVALLASNYSITIASYCLARYIDTKEKLLLACTILLTLGLVFFGSRSNIMGIYFMILICYLVKLRTRVSLIRIFSLAAVCVAMVLYLGNVRAGKYSLFTFASGVLFLIFFGNTFSDLRDFAWVYSTWNHSFWAGKTYLAGLMAFVPRFLSGFRNTWSIGVVTATTAGFDPELHPGLRPGIFGEGYFNFGIIGVAFVGLILGIVARRVDTDMKRALLANPPSMREAFASTTLEGIISSVVLSVGFSGLYVMALIILITWVCLGVAKLIGLRPAALPMS